MKDRNGKEVRIGDKACLVFAKNRDAIGLQGKVGEVRDICPYAFGINKPIARISDGPDDFPNWSSWCNSSEFAVVG